MNGGEPLKKQRSFFAIGSHWSEYYCRNVRIAESIKLDKFSGIAYFPKALSLLLPDLDLYHFLLIIFLNTFESVGVF